MILRSALFDLFPAERKALVEQGRVIGALLLREIRIRNGAHRLGYLITFVDLAASILILSFLYNIISRHPPLGTNMVMFMTSGIFTLRMFSAIETQVRNAISANRALLGYPPVKTFDVFIARFILEVVNYLALIFILAIIFSMLKVGFLSHSPFKIIAGFLLIAFLGFSFGMASCIIFHFFPLLEKIYGYLKALLMIGSAIFFLPDSMPVQVRIFLDWNPLVHIISFLREGFYQGYRSQYSDVSYVLLFCLVCFVVGMGGERLFRKRLLLPT